MALSADEKRQLDEIERGLISKDPAFCELMSVGRSRRRTVTMLALVVTGFLVGIGLVTLGVVLGGAAATGLAVAGFGILVGSCWFAVRLWLRRSRRR